MNGADIVARLTERFGSADHGNSGSPRPLELRMILWHGRGDDERARAGDVGRIVTLVDRDAESAEIVHADRVGISNIA